MMKYKPINSLESPRFAEVKTFMRLPYVKTTEGIDYAIELSIGYAVHSGQEQDLQKLIFAADHNMYEEKLKRKQYAKS